MIYRMNQDKKKEARKRNDKENLSPSEIRKKNVNNRAIFMLVKTGTKCLKNLFLIFRTALIQNMR